MRKLTLTGNVGADAVVLTNSQTGKQFATFSIATRVGEKTEWTKITCNGKFTEVAANYIKKGTKILIEGLPEINSYTTKDSEFKAELTCFATSIELLAKPPVHEENLPNTDINPEDIPF